MTLPYLVWTVPFELKFFVYLKRAKIFFFYSLILFLSKPNSSLGGLNICDHIVNVESKIFSSLSFLFGKILVRAI
jgi:hypothetical protein